MDDKQVLAIVDDLKKRGAAFGGFSPRAVQKVLTETGATEQQIAAALQYFQGGSAPAVRLPVTNPGGPTPTAPVAPAPAPAPAPAAPAPAPAPAAPARTAVNKFTPEQLEAMRSPGKFGGPLPGTKNAAAARLKAVSYLNGTAPPKLSGQGITAAKLNAQTKALEDALRAAGRLPEGVDVPKFTGKTPPKALVDLKGSLPGGLGAGPAGAAPAPAPASAPAPKGTKAPRVATPPRPGPFVPPVGSAIPSPKIFPGTLTPPEFLGKVDDVNPAIQYGTKNPAGGYTPVPKSRIPTSRIPLPTAAGLNMGDVPSGTPISPRPSPRPPIGGSGPIDPSKLPVPAGSVPKNPFAAAAASGADDAAKLAARAARFRGLVPSLGFGALGLGFMFMDARAQQRARQEELQNFAMQTTMGTQQRAARESEFSRAVGETDRLQAMAALSEAGATMDPREMELAALLGQTGAIAAQRAAVAPQLDEVALDHVLRMT